MGLDGVAHLGEDLHHGGVPGQHVGGEAADVLFPGDADEVLEQVGSDAPVLPVLVRGEGDLGEVRLRVADVVAHGNDLLPALGLFLADDRCDGHPVVVVDGGHGHGELVREGLQTLEEPRVDVLLGELVDHVLDRALVRGLHRPQEHLRAGLVLPVGLVLLGVEHRRQDLVLVDVALVLRRLEELIPELGMGDVDERHGPVTDGFAVDVSHAVLGDHVVDVAPGDHDAAAWVMVRDDPRMVPVVRGGGEHHDRLAPVGHGRAPDEVHLAPDAAVEQEAQRVGAHLAREVHRERRVDGHHLVVARDDVGVVDVPGGVELEERVVVHVAVELFRAHAEARHDLPRVQGLLLSRDHARLDEVDHAVGEGLGVHAQVPLVHEVGEHGVGDPAHARLDGGLVLDEVGKVLADTLGDPGGRFSLELQQGHVVLHERMDLADVEKAVAQRPGHVGIDLRHHVAGHLGSRLGDVHGDAQGDVTVVVRGRHGDERHVDVHAAPDHEQGDLGEEDGGVVRAALLDGLAGARADEQGVVPEVLVELLVRVGRDAQVEEVEDLGVREVPRDVYERLHQELRLSARGADENPRPPPDPRQGGLCVREPALIGVLPVAYHGVSFDPPRQKRSVGVFPEGVPSPSRRGRNG